MAEEQQIAEETIPAAPPAPSRKSAKGMLLLLIMLLAGGGGGYYAYMNYFQPKPAEQVTEQTPADPAAEKEAANSVMVPLEPFLVNLAGSDGKRFLKVTMTLELNAPEVQAEVQAHVQKILDSILVLLSSKTFEDVYSIQGKFKLKDEITTRVNRFLVMGHIKDVYFSEFVIQ